MMVKVEPYTLVHTLPIDTPVQCTKQSSAAATLHAVSPPVKILQTETEQAPPEHSIDEFWHGVSFTLAVAV